MKNNYMLVMLQKQGGARSGKSPYQVLRKWAELPKETTKNMADEFAGLNNGYRFFAVAPECQMNYTLNQIVYLA